MTHSLDFPGGDHGVLLAHGLCANPLELQHLAKRLNQAGYSVRVPYIPGYGVSQQSSRGGPRVDPYPHWIDALEAEYLKFRESCDTVSLGGLCIGANLSLALAARRPDEIHSLLLASPTLFYDGWNVPWTRRLLPIAYLPPIRNWTWHRETAPYGVKNPRLREWIAAQMQASGVSAAGAAVLPMRAIHQADRLIRQVKRWLPQITTPALVMHAVEDDVAGPRSPRLIESHLGTRDVEVRWFHDSYHMITIDNEKDAVARAAVNYLHQRVQHAVNLKEIA
jgi:carboxylesterase